MRRNLNNRVWFFIFILILLCIVSYIFNISNRTRYYLRNYAAESAYKKALSASSPIIENTRICSTSKVDLLFIIISIDSHFLERQSIRETWASMPNVFSVHSKSIFVIGYQPGGYFHQDLLDEAKHEEDLLYLTVSDHAVTLKELYAYQWLNQHCSNALYVFKAEDDLFVNTILLHELIRELKRTPSIEETPSLHNVSLQTFFPNAVDFGEKKFLYGWSYVPGRPERNITYSPYYITYEEYANEFYPTYCSGFGYLMNAQTNKVLTIEASKDTKPFRFPDIFMTGIVPERLNFTCKMFPFTFYQGSTDRCIDYIKNTGEGQSTPIVVCSTGRHTGDSSFNDYYKIWIALTQTYGSKLI